MTNNEEIKEKKYTYPEILMKYFPKVEISPEVLFVGIREPTEDEIEYGKELESLAF